MKNKHKKNELQKSLDDLRRTRDKTLRSLDDLQRLIKHIRERQRKKFEKEFKTMKKKVVKRRKH